MVKGKLKSVSPQRYGASKYYGTHTGNKPKDILKYETPRSTTEDDSGKHKRAKGKKVVIVAVVLILVIFISGQLLYLYIIPRVTIDFKTVYHEATGGGGTGGLINVNTKFINSGTIEVDDFRMTVSVLDATQKLLTNGTYNQGIVYPGDSYELKLTTNGNSYEKFYIILEIEFGTEKNEYTKKYVYETHEVAMNIGFEDSIFDWGL